VNFHLAFDNRKSLIHNSKTGYLLLEDGRCWEGRLYGSPPPALGEVVFNTGMSGYQEVIYDPSYWGQIVVMTVPHVGNTGVNPEDEEAQQPFLSGFIARSFEEPSSWRNIASLQKRMRDSNIPGLQGLDTRSITRHLRNVGCLRGGIFDGGYSREEALRVVQAHPSISGCDGASMVSCTECYEWDRSNLDRWRGLNPSVGNERELRVAVIDYGVKHNILRRLVETGCTVKVFPSRTSAAEVENYAPDGILLSNGPADPAAVVGAVPFIQHFLGRLPIFGICLGHQLLALAAGGRTYKMKFGHRGINHPVAERADGRVLVTVHNHGFAVADDPLPPGARVTLRSLNDQTIEGLDYPDLRAFSVQFHPEASPGPHDAGDLFLEFRKRMRC
jgi:carbamoyl-phosphate synthase small subunit